MKRKSFWVFLIVCGFVTLYFTQGESGPINSSNLQKKTNDNSWNILAPSYRQDSALDALSFEWEYFQIHSQEFRGVVGFILQNPRNRKNPFSALIPSGLGLAFGGEMLSVGKGPVSEYTNFDFKNFELKSDSKNTQTRALTATEPSARMEFLDPEKVHIVGQNNSFSWDLVFKKETLLQSSREGKNVFPIATDTKMTAGVRGQEWNVHAIWPRAKVTGSIQEKGTGKNVEITGKGYRENSWGRYAMPLDGWDFLVFNEENLPSFQKTRLFRFGF
jgi:hypothetical protein